VVDGEIEFASLRHEFEQLTRFVETSLGQDPLPGTLYAIALMHLLTGEPGKPDRYSTYVTQQLITTRRFDFAAVVAFDWCFDAIPANERANIAANLDHLMDPPLAPTDNPFDHLTFGTRLCAVAGAITLSGTTVPRSSRDRETTKVLDAAAVYFNGPFIDALNDRGAMATSPARAVHENGDAAFAVEIWRTGTGQDLWPGLGASLGRCCEPHFWMRTEYPGCDHGFVHDDGSHTPAAPARHGYGFDRAVPLVIARRVHDPVAVWFNRRVDGALLDAEDQDAWMRILYHHPDIAPAQRVLAPLGRSFGGGWTVLRSSWQPDAIVVLFDGGQPLLRDRQHYDAGQFQIFRKGLLAPDAGDDVSLETVVSKGGWARFGHDASARADWDQYARATIAHNCVTVFDPRQAIRQGDDLWRAVGNQRRSDAAEAVNASSTQRIGHVTGRLVAFETNAAYSYVAADLTEAYDRRRVQRYIRQILLLNDGLMLVCDRIDAVRTLQTRTWHLQLPNHPTLDGAALDAAHRERGGPTAGVWRMDAGTHRLATDNRNGRLTVQTLEPPDAIWHIAGGPKTPHVIPEGRSKGTTYFGGDEDGYEHLTLPIHISSHNNAHYRLGNPTRLGPQFGLGAVWGRLDVQAPSDPVETRFVHLLIPSDVSTRALPKTTWTRQGEGGVLTGEIGTHAFRITLSLNGPLTGRVQLTDRVSGEPRFDKSLTTTVAPQSPAPVTR
jgi:hypothetical protein